MKILSIDACAKVASAALCEDKKLIALYTVNTGNTHSETLLPMIESLLNCSGLCSDDIDLFALSAGPGSFTGVRIGAATLKGLAFGKGKPCVPVSTLHALAENISFAEGVICPVMDARREQFYTALFSSSGGKLERIYDDECLGAKDIIKRLKRYKRQIYLCGDGAEIFEQFTERAGISVQPVSVFLKFENAYSVAKIAFDKYARGEYTDDIKIKPTYLRLPQAERERLEKERQKNNGQNL